MTCTNRVASTWAGRRSRRTLMLAVALGILHGAAALTARAQSGFPARPIKVIVSLPAGGVTDVTVRRIADRFQMLSEKFTAWARAQLAVEKEIVEQFNLADAAPKPAAGAVPAGGAPR